MNKLQKAIREKLNEAGRHAIGLTLFFALFMAVFYFCAWFKDAFWQEPLGADGLILSFVLFFILYKGFPMIARLLKLVR